MYDVWKEKRERSILSLYNKRNIKVFNISDIKKIDESIENNKNIHNWQCLICNYIWKTNLNNLINHNSGCKKCNSGKNEEMVRRIFESLFGEKFETTRAIDNLKYENGRNLELDGYNKKLSLAFEYQGIQHEKITFHHSPSKNKIKKYNMTETEIEEHKKNKFIEQQKRDLFKTEKCKEIGIILIIISYKDCKKLNEESYKVIIKKKILEKNPESQIILITADEKTSKRVNKTISSGVTAFIQKPFTINDLKDAIKTAESEYSILQ